MIFLSKMENITDFRADRSMFYLDEDPRTKNWFLIDSPGTVATLIAVYVAFVTKVGPAMMKDHKEFQLKKFMLFYNAFQIIYCAALVIFSFVPFMQFRPSCATLSFADEDIINAQLSYAFFLLKIIDLLDTIIFVLRKKSRQITFLHVFHHVYVVILGYVHTRYLAGTQVALLNVLNGSVHVAMYYYYLVTSLTNQAPWWKKYITSMQLLQLTALSSCMVPTMFNRACSFPKLAVLGFMFLPNLVLISEFGSFYKRSYVALTSGKTKKDE